jgi:cytochrome c peroxidase
VVSISAVAFVACDEDTDQPLPEPCADFPFDAVPPPDWSPGDTLSFRPPGFIPQDVPVGNPITERGLELGRMLFYDPILSGDSTLACAGCHQQEHAFADSLRFSKGINGEEGARNAPHLTNAGWLDLQFWDGRRSSLEGQAQDPVTDVNEMDLTWEEAVCRLQNHPHYPARFAAAFGTPLVTKDRTLNAIGQFERSLVSANSRFDRFVLGLGSLTQDEIIGLTLFQTERADCFHCHLPDLGLWTTNTFHNIGIDSVLVDLGRGSITDDPLDIGKFKAPSLRNLAFTAPYMHDGRFETLREVVDHYNSGGFRSPNVDPLIRVDIGLGLTETEIDQLIAFLHTLSDSSFVTNPDYSNPFQP